MVKERGGGRIFKGGGGGERNKGSTPGSGAEEGESQLSWGRGGRLGKIRLLGSEEEYFRRGQEKCREVRGVNANLWCKRGEKDNGSCWGVIL